MLSVCATISLIKSQNRGYEVNKGERMHTAYLKKYANVNLALKTIYYWEARDRWGQMIAREHTKKECELACRRKGYCPVDDRERKN